MIIIDRIEGDLAVLEIEGDTYHLPVSALPEGAGEGAVLRLQLDPQARESIERDNAARLERLKNRGPKLGKGGILSL
jgi:type II secretory ATPase GspE/PulE/Tfp pilus assembly ATPase PilB-like protein